MRYLFIPVVPGGVVVEVASSGLVVPHGAVVKLPVDDRGVVTGKHAQARLAAAYSILEYEQFGGHW